MKQLNIGVQNLLFGESRAEGQTELCSQRRPVSRRPYCLYRHAGRRLYAERPRAARWPGATAARRRAALRPHCRSSGGSGCSGGGSAAAPAAAGACCGYSQAQHAGGGRAGGADDGALPDGRARGHRRGLGPLGTLRSAAFPITCATSSCSSSTSAAFSPTTRRWRSTRRCTTLRPLSATLPTRCAASTSRTPSS